MGKLPIFFSKLVTRYRMHLEKATNLKKVIVNAFFASFRRLWYISEMRKTTESISKNVEFSV